MEEKKITNIEIYEKVKKYISKSKDMKTIKCILLDTLDNAKDSYYLAENAYYDYIKK